MTKSNTYATISAVANHITNISRTLLIGLVSIQVFLFQEGLWIMRNELLIATLITLGILLLSIITDEITSRIYYDYIDEEFELEDHLINS